MRHRLDGAMLYLAGPMDDAKDRGSKWRQEITPWLQDLGIGVLCPFSKAVYGGEDEDDSYFDEINQLKAAGLFDEAHERMSPVAADDYRMVDLSSAVILYLDKNTHMCGSYHENCMASYQRKPVIVCCPQGKAAVPNWIHSVGRHRMFFTNWDEVKAYILRACYQEDFDTENRWRFFDYDKVFGRKV